MVPSDDDASQQRARIEQLIERFREEKRRQVLRRAVKLRRRIEADKRPAMLELPPARVH